MFPAGYAVLQTTDESRSRPILVDVWYPASADAREAPIDYRPGSGYVVAGLSSVEVPVHIVGSVRNDFLPFDHNAGRYARLVPNAQQDHPGLPGRALDPLKEECMPVYTIAQYRVNAKAVNKVRKAVAEFVRYVKANEPRTRLYAAWQEKEDPTRFVHFFIFEDEAAHEAHGKSAAVKRFESIYGPELVGGPVNFTDYNLVASNSG